MMGRSISGCLSQSGSLVPPLGHLNGTKFGLARVTVPGGWFYLEVFAWNLYDHVFLGQSRARPTLALRDLVPLASDGSDYDVTKLLWQFSVQMSMDKGPSRRT